MTDEAPVDEHEHEHHHQHLSREAALTAEREAAAHYYQHQFDWRGEPIPEGFSGPRYFDLDPDRARAPVRTVPGRHVRHGEVRLRPVPDVWLDEDGTAELDFNRAYDPSCADSPKYDCPYPPRGNRLDLPVRAGEMVPVEGQ